MRYVFDQHEMVGVFVARRMRYGVADFGNYRAIGICDDAGELRAGLVYHNFSPHAGLIEISGAAVPWYPWATRETLRVMHGYPFAQCGCQMVVMRVRWEDERLLRQLAALGYDFIKVPRMYGRHEHGVLCCLTDDDWRNNRITKRLHRRMIPEQKEAA